MKPSKNAAPASDRTKRIPESVGHAVTPGERPPPSRSLPPELARLYTGIDVAQETLEVAVLDGLGNVVSGSASYPNTPEGHDRLWTDTQALAARLQLPIAYAMEASGIYHLDLLYFIIERKAHAWSFNALLLKEEKGGSIRKTKTDPIDARRIAEYARTKGRLRPFATWNAVDKRLRERCRVRHRMMVKCSDAQRQLRRSLDLLVPSLAPVLGPLDHPSARAVCLAVFQQTKFPHVSQDELEKVLEPFHIQTHQVPLKAEKIVERLAACRPPAGMVEPLIDEVKFLVRQMELFEEQVRQENDRIAREMEQRESLLFTVPGVGPVVAAVVASELGDPHRFACAEAVVAFAGLDPSKRQSGKFDGRLNPISKRGSPSLRAAVYQAALTAWRTEEVSREFAERLRGRGKAFKVATVALARKILVWCWIVLRDHVPWEAGRARGPSPRVNIPGKSMPG